MKPLALTRRMLAVGAAALLLFSLPLSARTLVYNGDQIEGWVVDAETGVPLEGVNIVVH